MVEHPGGFRAAAVVVLAGGLAMSCERAATTVPPWPSPGVRHTEMGSGRFAGTPEAHWPDQAVARGVRAAIADQLGSAAAGTLSVQVKHGVAVLKGATDTLLAKQGAGEAAKAVRGVRAVVNQVDVHPPTVPDQTIAAGIRRAWSVLPCGEQSRLKVDARDGVVTLRGVLASQQQKRWAAQAAAGVRGVVGVHDEILVSPPPARPADQIAEDVRNRLRWALPLDGKDIAVQVNHGVVTLTGKVATPADFDRAEMLATQVTGVYAADVASLAVDPAAFPAEPHAPAAAFASDDAVAQAVRDAMFYDPRLDSYDVAVSVHRGVATLTGQVPTLRAARAAVKDALGTVGVSRTIDRIGVAPAPASDALLARGIRESLARDPMADLAKLRVQVRRGRARLFGTVGGQLAHTRALEVAASVRGVQSLQDDIRVADQRAPAPSGPHRQSRAAPVIR